MPTQIINAPVSTVQRTPIRSATQPMKIAPSPAPNQDMAAAKAGTSRGAPRSAAIAFIATTTTSGEP